MQYSDLEHLAAHLGDYVVDTPQLRYAVACIAFNPVFWNVVARLEHKTRFISRVTGPYLGCYLLAATIFSLGIYRDAVYHAALLEQPTYAPLVELRVVRAVAVAAFGCGNVFVLTSMYALGVTGTYLGDYFGILMSLRVTGFPFSVNDNPMYNGSTLVFLGTALWYGKPTGVLVAVFVYAMYKVALLFEEPYTARIYAKRD